MLVDSRQRPFQWVLRRTGTVRAVAHGAQNGYQLRVPTPRGAAGLYQLAIRSGPYRTEVPLVVHATQPRRGILVVLPALTWQGQNQVDDDADGLPDTLDGGGRVQLNRVLAGGLPAGFGEQAAILAYLDQSHLGYDLTTDIGLIGGSGPQLGGHSGVVLAGSERWLPNSLAAALRAYVQRGGRVLSLGVESLQRGVTIQGVGPLLQAQAPTAPGATDALGRSSQPRARPILRRRSSAIGSGAGSSSRSDCPASALVSPTASMRRN
jgi:hypothetical protein